MKNQYVELFEGKLGLVVETNSEIQFGDYKVKCITETDNGIDDFYVDGELVDFCEIVEKEVDFSKIPVVCFKTDGYRNVGCYFCIGLIDNEIVLIDTMDGSMLGR